MNTGSRRKARRRIPRNPHILKRHNARTRAFLTLYGLSFRTVPDQSSLWRAFEMIPGNKMEPTQNEGALLARELVRGVWSNEAELDRAINCFSHKWRADRLGRIELILLRLALYELFCQKTPLKVIKSEIMDLAMRFGAGEASNMLDGILEAASKASAAGDGAYKWKNCQADGEK